MQEKKYVWLGEAGYNPVAGHVQKNSVVLLNAVQSEFLLERGLIVEYKARKKGVENG